MALTEPGHIGELYEVTGPELITFADAVAQIAEASGREIRYVPVPWRRTRPCRWGVRYRPTSSRMLAEVFAEVLDGHNAWLGGGVQRALGRPSWIRRLCPGRRRHRIWDR